MSKSKRTVILGAVLASIVSVILLSVVPMIHSSVDLPEYNSGWISINQGESITLTHNLGTTAVSIEMWGKDIAGNIHQRNYGRNQPPHKNYIDLRGFVNPPEYDSGWVNLPRATTGPGILPPVYPTETTFDHNLGTYDVLVYVLADDDSGRYVQIPNAMVGSHGGENNWFLTSTNQIMLKNWVYDRDVSVHIMIWKIEEPPWEYTQQIGAYWDNLTSSTIDVYRAPNDEDWNQVRIRIWKIVKAQPTPPVGGLLLPINMDTFEPLTPWIALVSTVILAISASVAYIKYRKKQ